MTDRSTVSAKTEPTVDVENDALVAMILAQADAVPASAHATLAEFFE